MMPFSADSKRGRRYKEGDKEKIERKNSRDRGRRIKETKRGEEERIKRRLS